MYKVALGFDKSGNETVSSGGEKLKDVYANLARKDFLLDDLVSPSKTVNGVISPDM